MIDDSPCSSIRPTNDTIRSYSWIVETQRLVLCFMRQKLCPSKTVKKMHSAGVMEATIPRSSPLMP
jgi:hypothetical protein